MHLNFTGANNKTRRRRHDTDRTAQRSAIRLRLHHAANEHEPARLSSICRAPDHAVGDFERAVERLFPPLQPVPRGWQHDGRAALRPATAFIGPPLCFGDGSHASAWVRDGNQPRQIFRTGNQLGEIDRTRINTNSIGGTLQANQHRQGRRPRRISFVIGTSVDHGWTQFRGDSEIGVIQPNLFVSRPWTVPRPATWVTNGVGPVSIGATKIPTSVSMRSTRSTSPRASSITGGGRFNFAEIDLVDQLGGSAGGNNSYHAVQPGDRRHL